MERHLAPREQTQTLSDSEIAVLVNLERAGAVASMVGVVMIFITYWIFPRLRTVPNLFIVFASIANVGASIACIMGYDGIRAGLDSALCQTQAFLLELFMQSDPWWSFAMAVNVFLVFFFGANPASFRKHLWLYCLVCFGVPAIPAIACLFIQNEKQGRVYGDATLWCWIASKWNALRIYTYYLPIWICILLSTVIYFAVGYHVFHQRNQLRNLTFSNRGKEAKDTSVSDIRDSAEKNLTRNTDAFPPTVVTEVQVTTERPGSWSTSPGLMEVPPAHTNPSEISSHRPWPAGDGDRPSDGDPTAHSRFETICTSNPPPPSQSFVQRLRDAFRKFTFKLRHLDPIKLAYLRTSFVFAISVLVTWTPSSINRVYSLVYPTRVSFGLNVASAFVLPLQGVWNAVIFFTTSWKPLRHEIKQRIAERQSRRLSRRIDNQHNRVILENMGMEQRNRFDRSRFERRHHDDTTELELGSPVGTVRAMEGAF